MRTREEKIARMVDYADRQLANGSDVASVIEAVWEDGHDAGAAEGYRDAGEDASAAWDSPRW